jgi:transcriptional regulator with XRE-family HTH domain
MSIDLVNIIFGMKVRQARIEAGLTLTELAERCELSPSYMTEIEKGRKHPRADKILRLAQVLGKEYDDLVSIKLAPSLAHLGSALSSSILQRFPFAEFGLEAGDLINLITREPDKASALIHAILEIGRRFDLQEEDFLRAALRSYQEIHENYFQELEDAAEAFTADLEAHEASAERGPLSLDTLAAILKQKYSDQIDETSISTDSPLSVYRSIFIQGKQPRLLVNSALLPRQIRFLLARELSYQYLGLETRSFTSTPDRIDSFQQILNDFKAAYLGGALLMPRTAMIADLQQLFDRSTWDHQPLLDLLAKYDVTPEMLLYRFSELIPQYFGLKLHFLRFHSSGDSFALIKQLNMNQLLVPSGIGLHEHYCRRWLSVRLLSEMNPKHASQHPEEAIHVGVQLSEFLDSQDRFLCFGFARPLTLSPNVNSSVTVGFRVDADLKNSIRFLNDPIIPSVIINETCERCPLLAEQCQERAAEPTILREDQAKTVRKLALSELAAERAGS